MMSKYLKFLLDFCLIKAVGDEDGGAADDGEVGSNGNQFQYDDDGNIVGNGGDARLALMNQINDSNDGKRAEELLDVGEGDNLEPFQVQNADGTTETLEDETQPTNTDDIQNGFSTENKEDQNNQKYKLKVNGQEIELTFDELVKRAQKVEAADQYLAEASRIRNQAITENQSLSNQDDLNHGVDEDDLALARAIQMGDEEEAVAAIKKLRAQGPSADDLARTVDERLTFRDAFSRFKDEYKDIVSNPYLNKLAIDRDVELVSQGDTRPYWERYQAIGEEVRSFVQNMASQAGFVKPAEVKTDPQQQTIQNRQERKENARSAPTSAGAKTANSTKEEKEETTADIIGNMARSRGGPQWMHGFQG
jgi:hypothetical protein